MFLYVETNEDEITQWSKFGGQSEKAVLRRKFTAMQAGLPQETKISKSLTSKWPRKKENEAQS